MKVKELLSDESKWTRSAYARDSMGHSVSSTDPDARCWCLQGAINKCYQGKLHQQKEEAMIKLGEVIQRQYGTPSIFHFNDRRATFDDIKKVLEMTDI